MSPEQENLVTAHRSEKSSGTKSTKTQPDENPEPSKESSTALEESNINKIIEVPEVIPKPPQVDLDLMWKMFVDEARNSLGVRVGAGVGMVLISLEGAIF